MEEMNTPKRFLQVGRVDSKGKILDFTDPNRFSGIYDPKPGEDEEKSFAPKFELNYTRYNTESQSAEAKHRHYIDVDVMRLLAWDILNGNIGTKGEKGYNPILDEFKGSFVDSVSLQKFDEKKLISRRLTVQYNDSLRIGPVYSFMFVAADGEKGEKGQVKPIKGGQEYLKEFIYIPVDNARKISLRILHWLQAKDAAALVRG